MRRHLILYVLFLAGTLARNSYGVLPPAGLVSRAGDQSIVLHWDPNQEPGIAGYNIYRALTNGGPFTLLNTTGLVTTLGYCDLSPSVANGRTNYYRLTAVNGTSQESAPSVSIPVTPHLFIDDDDFLDYVQQVSFDYFWYLANPTNGLVPDRSATGSACSIAAVGFGLTSIAIAADHGWITRTQAAARVLTTLNTFLNGPQGTNTFGMIGYRGWFYHFLDMTSATRFSAELSSIDTALLLAGIVDAKQYFNGTNADESSIRSTADAIFNRIDWNWMANGTNVLAMGWNPGAGFIPSDWIGYNEAMILYCFALGAPTNPLPSSAWTAWTSGYTWATYYGYSYVPFPPLFAHQYSHCWIDFRHIGDAYMNSHNSTYFENSRRASLSQRAYCIANPNKRVGYNGTVWGLTACDGPPGYSAHGAPPAEGDDGTIAPTAAGGSIAFTPEYSVPTLRYFYSNFRTRMWTAFGFRDAFNLGASWVASDELGIDQGPIVIMIENYRTQRVWQRFMENDVVQRGLRSAGFVPLDFVATRLQLEPSLNSVTLNWGAPAGGTFQVEYSPDLSTWFESPTGEVNSLGPSGTWIDNGPPGTISSPASVNNRFYRVFQFGPP
ncbi:MAG TPA: glucoamylase family protein [Verrucomicrobiae bacterium]|nr:glucoamylase family protein [Verrucomicrobiae bacterium]